MSPKKYLFLFILLLPFLSIGQDRWIFSTEANRAVYHPMQEQLPSIATDIRIELMYDTGPVYVGLGIGTMGNNGLISLIGAGYLDKRKRLLGQLTIDLREGLLDPNSEFDFKIGSTFRVRYTQKVYRPLKVFIGGMYGFNGVQMVAGGQAGIMVMLK